MRNFVKQLSKAAIVFCCIFTILFGGFLLMHSNDVAKIVTVVSLIKNNYLNDFETDDMFEGVIAGIVASLGDKYSTYYTKEETKTLFSSIQGVFGGIGVYVPSDSEKTIVSGTVKDGAAERAGIRQNDVIIAVDGENVTRLSSDEVVAKIRGEIGTEVQISVMRQSDNSIHDFTIIREAVNEISAMATLLEGHEDIAYLRITSFAQNTDEAVVDELNKLLHGQGFKGLIIDLRNNGGGDVDAAVNIARLFLPEGPVVHIVNNKNVDNVRYAKGAQIDVPLVVLVNQYSASASEILAGAIKDTKVGTLVGTTTYGKGLVQVVYPLNDGSSVKLTQSKYLTPNKNDINQVGITPDVEINFPEDMTIENFQDVQLDKAIEVLERML